MFIQLLIEIKNLFIEMAPYLMLGLFFVGILHLYFKKDLVLKYMGKDSFFSNLKAAVLGVPLPLCSCGVIPTTVYMAKNGASKSSTLSFLISTPQTGVDSIIATYGLMGPIFAIFRPIAAFIMGLGGGALTRIFGKNIDFSKSNTAAHAEDLLSENIKGFKAKFKEFFSYSFIRFLDDIAPQFIVGIILSGIIAYFIPNDFFARYHLNSGILGMLVLVLAGIPMYICATASIPIAVVLMLKGFSPGAAFVFLAAGPATNAASLSILFHAIGKKLTFIFVGTIVVFSMLMGLLFDFLIKTFNLDVTSYIKAGAMHDHGFALWQIVLAVVFLLLLLASVYRKWLKRYFVKNKKRTEGEMELTVEGMSCGHCAATVSNGLKKLEEVEEVEVSLDTKKVYIKGKAVKRSVVERIIEELGYKPVKERAFSVKGMTCGHCTATVKKGVEAIEGVESAEVALDGVNLVVKGDNLDSELIKKTVNDLGYEVDKEL